MFQKTHKLVHVHFDKEGGLGLQTIISLDAIGSQVTSGRSFCLSEPEISMERITILQYLTPEDNDFNFTLKHFKT